MKPRQYLLSGVTLIMLAVPAQSSAHSILHKFKDNHETLRTNLIQLYTTPEHTHIQGVFHIDETSGFENEYQLNRKILPDPYQAPNRNLRYKTIRRR